MPLFERQHSISHRYGIRLGVSVCKRLRKFITAFHFPHSFMTHEMQHLPVGCFLLKNCYYQVTSRYFDCDRRQGRKLKRGRLLRPVEAILDPTCVDSR